MTHDEAVIIDKLMKMSETKFNDETNCICLCGLKFKDKDDDDNSQSVGLKNWELWMQRRKRTHKLLGGLGRNPGDLLMNIGDEYRTVKEDKLLLGYTKIETNFDKLRGNPAFWKLPDCLKGTIPPRGTSEYFALKSNEEKNEIPSTEYVGVPDYILKEKDILPRTRNLFTLWKNSSYRNQVVQRKISKILEIEPHKPDVQNLILVGQQIRLATPLDTPAAATSTKENPPSILSTGTSSDIIIDKRSSKISVKINDIPFNQGCITHSNKITIIFQYFMDSSVSCKQTLFFENTGRTVLRFNFQHYKKLRIFREYCIDSKIVHPFIFNRNEILLLPGETFDFPIEFKTSKPGNYFEFWELNSRPRIWNEDFHLIIALKGFAYIKHFEEKANILTQNLNQRIRNTVIKDLLSDIISKGNYSSQNATSSYDFSEKELFESVNLKENICLRTPKYVYNKEVVAELNDLYQKMKQPTDAEQWTFSIRKLKEISRKKDLLIYFESSVAAYETARLKRKSMQENSGAASDSLHEKKNDKPAAVGKSTGGKGRKDVPSAQLEAEVPTQTMSYYNRLKDIIQRLEKPSIRPNLERKKYLLSYTIIRTYLFQMFDRLYSLDLGSDAIDDFKDKIGQSQMLKYAAPEKQSIKYMQDRLKYEIFEEGYISRTKRIPSEALYDFAQPKSTVLKGISLTDVKKIWKLYFNKEDVTEKSKKKKNVVQAIVSKKQTPSKNSEKSKKSGEVERDLLLNIKENFNPFDEKYFVKFEQGKTEHFELTIKDGKDIKNYTEKYLIIYTNLCGAIDDLVKTIDGLRKQNISSDTLRELQKCFTMPSQSDREVKPQEVVSSQETEVLIDKTPSGIAKEEYFKYLLDTHWQNNMKTKKYFVGEQKLVQEKKQPTDICSSDDLLNKALSNIYSQETFRRKPEPAGTKDRDMQTSSMDLKSLKGLTYESDVQTMTINDLETSPSKNIFYFLDNICEEDSDLNQ